MKTKLETSTKTKSKYDVERQSYNTTNSSASNGVSKYAKEREEISKYGAFNSAPKVEVKPTKQLPQSNFNLPAYDPDAKENNDNLIEKWNRYWTDKNIKADYDRYQQWQKEIQEGKSSNTDPKFIEDVKNFSSMTPEQYRLYSYQNENNPKYTPSVDPKNRVEFVDTGSKALNFAQRTLNKATNTFIMDDITETPSTGSKIGDFASNALGTIAGYATNAPGAGGSLLNLSQGLSKPVTNQVTKNIAKPLLNKLATGFVREGIEGAGLATLEGVAKNMDSKDIAKKAAIEGLVGGALGSAFEGAGQLIRSKFAKGNLEKIELPQPTKTTTPILQGNKFKVKNTNLEKAINIYNEAVETIQNKYGHWQLTPEEMASIKKDTGIDLGEIVSNIEKAEKGTPIKPLALNQNLAYVAGAKPMPELKLNQELVLTPKLDINLAPNLKPNVDIKGNVISDINPALKSEVKFVSSEKGKKFNFKEALSKFYTRTVDINNPIKNVDNGAYIKATNSKNVGGTVDHIMQSELVDQQGKTLGKSLKEIVEDIPKGQEEEFWNYLGHRHNIDRAAQGKNVFPDFDSRSSLNATKQIELQHPEYKSKADNLVKFVNDFMEEWGHKSGLIDDATWNNLKQMYPNYFPTHRNFDEIEEGLSNVFTNSKGFVGQSSPVKSATGSGRDIINPIENIMNLVNSTVRKARYNQVGQSMVEAINKNSQGLKQFAEIVPEVGNTNNIVKVLVQGNPIYVKINDKQLLESLEGLYKSSGDVADNFVRKLTNNYKSLITQKNPVFAIRNIARDVPTAYINGSQSNPIKFFTDLISAGKDLVKNTDVARQYKGLGGGGSNFFNIDKPYKSAKELTKKSLGKKIGGAIETFNNLTESAPRLAEFKRTLNTTKDTQKALLAASDVTTNFSRGGDIIKKYDAYVPYLNAGVQGLDKLARQFKNKPIATILKGATAITAPTLLLNAVNKDNPNYQQLDNRTKDNYYLIPNGDTFIKIPKSRELGVLFGSLTERLLNQVSGQENAFKDFGETVGTNFSPTNPVENNIFAPLIYNLPTNKDFAGRAIIPRNMEDRSPALQYDEATSEIGKKIGEIANLSPKQVDYLIKSYTGVIGQLTLPATTKKNYATGSPIEKILKPITTQFVADPLYSNNSITDFYNNYDKLKTKAADKNFSLNLPSKLVTQEEKLRNYYAKVSKQISELTKEIKSNEGNEEKVRELRKQIIQLAIQANSKMK